MKQIIAALLLLLPVMAEGQEKTPTNPPVGIAGYVFAGYSNPKGVAFEAGISTIYTKRDAVGGIRLGVGYSNAKYDPLNTSIITTINGVNVIKTTPIEWRANSFTFSGMIDPFPKKAGEINFSFAAGVAGMSTTVRAYDERGKQVGEDVYSDINFYPKISLGLGVTGMIITADLFLPIVEAEYTDLAPFNIGVLIYPRILFKPQEQTAK